MYDGVEFDDNERKHMKYNLSKIIDPTSYCNNLKMLGQYFKVKRGRKEMWGFFN